MATEEELREVKNRHSTFLLGLRSVVGVGVERDEQGEFALTVHLDADDPEDRKKLPTELEGHRVRYVMTGPYKKFTP
jgi:hypothetical protein